MRNLLRNKYSVGVLTAVAIYTIVMQFRTASTVGDPGSTASARQIDMASVVPVDASANGTGELKTISGTNTLTNLRQMLSGLMAEYPSGAEVRRDPFSREILHHSPAETQDQEPEVAAPEIPIKLELQALSIHSKGSFAVVNGRVVGAGDRLGTFEVESVMAEGVWLKGTNGRSCLKIDYLTPLKKLDGDPESATKP